MEISINGYKVEGSVEEIKQLLDLKEENNESENTEKERLISHVLRQINNAYNNIYPIAEVSKEIINTIHSDDGTYNEIRVVMELNYTEKEESIWK